MANNGFLLVGGMLLRHTDEMQCATMTIAISLCIHGVVAAQWPSDPSNLAICSASGEQAITKMADLDDGGCYISWFDNRSGGYDVYMQHLDAQGNPMWDENGILIADRTYSWTMDFGLTIDSDGNAVVVYRKNMLGGDGIVVSSVNQEGTILWHRTIQSGVSFVASPVICSSGDSIFAGWITNDDSRIQKLNNLGAVQWKTPTIMTDPAGGFFFLSDMQPSLDGSVMIAAVQYLIFSGNKRLKAQRIHSDGSIAWGELVSVMTSNSLQYGNYPDFVPDGAGGGFFTWYGVGPLQCYATRVSSDGNKWFAGEVQVASSFGSTERVDPVAVRDGSEFVVFFRSQDNNQNNDGIGVQRFSATGGLLWGNAGMTLKPTSSSPQYGSFAAAKTDTGVSLFFTEAASFGNDVINGVSVDRSGNTQWTPAFASVASTPSGKSRTVAASTGDGVLLAWQDDRNGSNDIYAQRVNSDGTLGNAASCTGDVDGDGVVGVTDVLLAIGSWGECVGCDADLNGDGMVDIVDLLTMIGAWGDC